jgi:Xaa-Pro aminopeptidase
MEAEGADAFLVAKPANIRYLSGFTSGEDAYLLVDGDGPTLVSDARYSSQAALECPDCVYEEHGGDPLDRVCAFGIKYKRLALEAAVISQREYARLEAKLGARLLPVENWVEDLRLVKNEAECERLRRAAALSGAVFAGLLEALQPGMRERDIAARLEYELKLAGAEALAFPTIAAAGANAALPHAKPGEYRIRPGDMLTVDWGGKVDGYVSDMTRTVAVVSASQRFKDEYARVLEAQEIGLSAVRAGVRTDEVDAKVRKALARYGLAAYFAHGTGHGIGLEIHEAPSVSPRSSVFLTRNMVITIEPGIYIPGYGGIRIEDSVIVTPQGAELITPVDKAFTII